MPKMLNSDQVEFYGQHGYLYPFRGLAPDSGLMPFLAVSLVVSVLAVGCSPLGPKPEIVGANARSAAPNFDYTVYVDCTVRNNGLDGDIEVTAELTGDGFWKKREVVRVAKDRERIVAFAFPEATLFGAGLSGLQYECSAISK